MTIVLDGYSSFKNTKLDKWFGIPQLCEMLIQHWARQQCAGSNMFKDSLRQFTLIKVEALAKQNGNGLGWIAGQKESVGAVVQRMKFIGTEPNTNCAPDGHPLCTAAVSLGGGVLAVWVVSASDSNADSVRRQGAAIRAFLAYAVSEQEDHEKFKAALGAAS